MSSLGSAGEDENISDELVTPRARKSSVKRSQPVKYDRRLSSRTTQNTAVADSDDDDDIMF